MYSNYTTKQTRDNGATLADWYDRKAEVSARRVFNGICLGLLALGVVAAYYLIH